MAKMKEFLKEYYKLNNPTKKTKKAIVNVNLQYEFPARMSDKAIKNQLMELELPSQYVEDSFEFVKIIKD